MTQAQHDRIEQVIADNRDFLVQWHEKPWAVIVDIRQRVPYRESWRTGAVIAIYPDGGWERDVRIPLADKEWPKGARTTPQLQRFA